MFLSSKIFIYYETDDVDSANGIFFSSSLGYIEGTECGPGWG